MMLPSCIPEPALVSQGLSLFAASAHQAQDYTNVLYFCDHDFISGPENQYLDQDIYRDEETPLY